MTEINPYLKRLFIEDILDPTEFSPYYDAEWKQGFYVGSDSKIQEINAVYDEKHFCKKMTLPLHQSLTDQDLESLLWTAASSVEEFSFSKGLTLDRKVALEETPMHAMLFNMDGDREKQIQVFEKYMHELYFGRDGTLLCWVELPALPPNQVCFLPISDHLGCITRSNHKIGAFVITDHLLKINLDV